MKNTQNCGGSINGKSGDDVEVVAAAKDLHSARVNLV